MATKAAPKRRVSKNPIVEAAPEGIFPGAVEVRPGVVSFAIYAPGKQRISVIGDWNAWDREADPLKVTNEGLWWTELQLKPGRHLYKFCVDGKQEIGDPYATELGEGTEVGQPAAQITVGAEPYAWQDSDWSPPPFNDLVIYELHIGDFNAPFTYQSVIEKLPYLQDLGINALEIMPISEFASEHHGWGYNPAYFFCPETSYGTPDELRALIDQAHQHGIAIIMDAVFAHTAHRHPFNQLYPYDQSPWYGASMAEQNQFGFPSLDHTKPAAQAFIRDVQNFWMNHYHIDGFRYDYTLGIGYNDENGVTRMVRDARANRPNVYLIAEQSPELPQMVRDTGLNGAWHVRFNYMLKALLREGQYHDWNWDNFGQLCEILDPHGQGYSDQAQMVNYLESHDESRVVYEVSTVEQFDEAVGRYKSALGAICLLTAPGVPMLLHGQEWGEATEKTTDANPLHWEALDSDGGRGLHDYYRRLIHLRHDHQALRMPGFAVDACYVAEKTIVFHRWDQGGDEVVVALNFSPAEQHVTVPFPSGAHWVDALSDYVVDAEGHAQVQLPPSSGRVFVKG